MNKLSYLFKHLKATVMLPWYGPVLPKAIVRSKRNVITTLVMTALYYEYSVTITILTITFLCTIQVYTNWQPGLIYSKPSSKALSSLPLLTLLCTDDCCISFISVPATFAVHQAYKTDAKYFLYRNGTLALYGYWRMLIHYK